MKQDCKFLDECRLPYDMCDDKCGLYQKVEHSFSTCKDPKRCSICEDEGYGDYLIG